MPFVLGIDVGTSACKATLVDRDGLAVSGQSDAYDFVAPQLEWAEQDPALWWDGVLQSVGRAMSLAECAPEQVVAVGVTGQMHTSVLLGPNNEILRPPLLWCDQRPVRESERAEASFPAIREITLNPLLPAFTLSKLLWVREHEPHTFRQIRHVLVPKDYLRYRLTGVMATEPSDAAGTAMFDARSWRWSTAILDQFGIPLDWLPPCIASADVSGHLTADAATSLGLREGTPVMAGAGDQAAQAVGLAATEADILGVQIGTSGVIVMASDRPVDGAFCHGVPARWLRLNALHSAGLSFAWLRDAFASSKSFEDLTAMAAGVEAGSGGLLYVPFLLGERAGYASSVPATFSGMHADHALPHFVRAVLEGVALELRRLLDEWTADGPRPTEMRLVGGGAQDRLWRHIFAQVFNIPLAYAARDSAYGAAVLAGCGLGWWRQAPPLEEAARMTPDPAEAQAYARAYGRYRALYASLSSYAKATVD